MREAPRALRLSDGRLRLIHGPIDLVMEAFGGPTAVQAAYRAGTARFAGVLDELCQELPVLRARSTPVSARPQGIVARRMADAVSLFHDDSFITPMAAVAGAVAQEILGAATSSAPLTRAYVNNGGDIALHLRPGENVRVGMIDRPDRPHPFGRATITAEDPVRGVATSGWRGRSFSLGIADAVTVLAKTAAVADAAATLIANAVDLPGHPAVRRAPARARDPQSDLGDRLVTLDVGPLTPDEVETALALGAAEAERWREAGFIEAAALRLGERSRLVAGAAGSYGTRVLVVDKQVRHALG